MDLHPTLRFRLWVVRSLLLIGLPTAAASQEAPPPAEVTVTLRGLVVDAESGSPIAGARVDVVEIARSTQADETGAFILENLPAGRYTIRAQRLGFAPAEQTDVPLAQDAILTLAMRPQAVVLDGISVEANGRLPALMAQLEERRRTVGVASSVHYQEDLLSTAADDMEDFILNRTRIRLGPCRRGGSGCPHLRGGEITPLVLVDEQVISFDDLHEIPPHHVAAAEVFQGGSMIRIYTTHFLGAYARANRPLPLQDIIRVQSPHPVDRGWTWDEFGKMRDRAVRKPGGGL